MTNEEFAKDLVKIEMELIEHILVKSATVYAEKLRQVQCEVLHLRSEVKRLKAKLGEV